MAKPSIRRILVAIKDPQARELASVSKAAQLARLFKAELVLFHAITEALYLDVSAATQRPVRVSEAAVVDSITAQLEQIAEPLRAEDVRISIQVVWDYPAYDAVTRAAVRVGADLVMVDCQRHAHPLRWFLHFTDWELLRHCPMPVLLVKGAGTYYHAPVLAAVDPDKSAGKPATLDGEILAYASCFAAALGTHLHAVHAYNPLPDLSASELVAPPLLAAAERRAEQHAHEVADPMLEEAGIPIVRRHIGEGFAIDVIEDAVRDSRAQVVVMGTVSRAGARGVLMGNTAERMLDRLGCDLLILKPPGFPKPLGQEPRGAHVVAVPVRPAVLSAVV